jgi:hypothetical protein
MSNTTEIDQLKVAFAWHQGVWGKVEDHMSREETKLDALHRRLDDFARDFPQSNAEAHGRIEGSISSLQVSHGERLSAVETSIVNLETLVRNGGKG